MKKSNYLVRQSVGSVDFVSDFRNGQIEYASFGGEDYWAEKVESDTKKVKGFLDGVDLLVLWVLAFQFNVKTAMHDFLVSITPIIGGCLNRTRWAMVKGVDKPTEVNTILADIWTVLSGNGKVRKNRAATFDPSKGAMSTWINFRVLSYVSDKKRHMKLAKKLLGLGLIVDDDTPLESLGGIMGLGFEPSDPDTQRSKWTKLSAKINNPTFDRVARLEESRGLQKILARLDQKDRDVLEGYFLEGLTFQQLADKCGFANKSGPQKAVLRIVNGLRDHYKRGEEKIVRLGGKKNRNLQFVSVE